MGGTLLYPGSSFKGSKNEMQAGVMVWNGSAYQTIEGTHLGSIWGGTAYPNGDGRLLTGSSGPHRSIQEVSNTGIYIRKYIDEANLSGTRGVRSDVWWVWFRLRRAHTTWSGSGSPAAVITALYPYRIVRPGDPARDGKYVYIKMTAPRMRAPRLFQIQNYYTFISQGVIDNNPLIVRNPLQQHLYYRYEKKYFVSRMDIMRCFSGMYQRQPESARINNYRNGYVR